MIQYQLNNWKNQTLPKQLSNKIMELIKELKKQGFKQYQHRSGIIVWSIENLLEFSDEWELC